MIWSILICTLSWRERQFLAQVKSLLAQARVFQGEVEVVALRNSGELLIHDYRQAMLDDPLVGEYVSFVDDDDLVADYYVSDVMAALRQSPDIVGFTAAVSGCGENVDRSFFSIHSVPSQGPREGAFYRTVSCWSPVRTSLARKGSYLARDLYEDEAFARSLAPHLEGAREVRVRRPILAYTGSHLDSCQFGGPGVPIGPLTGRRGPEERPVIGDPCFRWHEGEVRASHALPIIRQPQRYYPDGE